MRDTLSAMVERRLARNFDFTLLLVTFAIVTFGCFMIYSASRGGAAGAGYVQKQIVWAIVGIVLGVIVASINHTIYARFAGKMYWFTIIMLLAVLKLAVEVNGAKSWIKFHGISVQPSEFAKILLLICLAVFLVSRQETIRSFGVFAKSLIYLAVPLVLILKQPDLGTSMVIVSIWLVMVFVMGTDLKNILLFIVGGVLLVLVAWNVPGIMKTYQKDRVLTLVNPRADPLGSGYHVNQSRIAIGSGRMFGKGYLKGTQSELNFIPEQHTDFIFTVVGEETGFAGSVTVLVLYFLLLWRAMVIMAAAEDSTGRAIAAGIVGMFAFHIIENIGMTLGIMPVTGVPLSMFSYGGSALMANMMAIGLLEGISMRRHKISF